MEKVNVEKFLKVGDKIRFDLFSDNVDLNEFLEENGFYNMNLVVKSIDLDNEQFWVDNIPNAISINDNFEIVKFEILENKIEKLKQDRYICYSVKELAYRIMGEFVDNDFYIDYKLVKTNNNHYIHKVAFQFDNFYMVFDIVWSGNALIITDNQFVESLDVGFEDIECVIDDE